MLEIAIPRCRKAARSGQDLATPLQADLYASSPCRE